MATSPLLTSPLEILEPLFAVMICTIVIFRTAYAFLLRRTTPVWNRGRIALEVFFWLVAVFLAGYLVADLNRTFQDQLDRSVLTAMMVISIIGSVAFSGVSLCAGLGSKFLGRRSIQLINALYLSLLIGAGAWLVNRTYAPTALAFGQGPIDSLNLMSEASNYVAITDNGSQLILFEIDIRDRSDEAREFLATSTITPDNAKVIPRAEANINANCHGWVFTAGKYLLKGRSVDLILADNGYILQGTPEPGDIIVYRSSEGECLHTGIVGGILLDGTCIIESKWGIAGRYLHQAEDQPYGLNYAFYRSPRSGHLVTIVHKDEVDSFLTNLKTASSSASLVKDEAEIPNEYDESELQPSLFE